jgi:hypothetical protein
LFIAALCCQAADDAVQPPVKGRPVLFSGIVGAVELEASAAPTELPAESPLVFKLRLKGPPTLATLAVPDLHKIKGFDAAFAIRFLSERWLPQEKMREFEFELRPRLSSVEAIPPFPFVFYVPAERSYQTRYTPSIPLHITSRAATPVQELKIENLPENPAEHKLSFDFSRAVLAESTPPWAPAWGLLAFIAALPPVLAWLRIRRVWSTRYRPGPECSRTLELARALSGVNFEVQDADEQVRVLLDSNNGILAANARSFPHGPQCHCRELLSACQAYLYGGKRRELLGQLVKEADTFIPLEQRGGG